MLAVLRHHRVLIFFYLAVALGIILFASPLFRVLGFEYSAISALAVSLATMLAVLRYERTSGDILRAHVVLHLLSLIPLLVSLASLLFIPNCALGDGIVFYFQIVPFTTEIAILLGLFIGATAPSRPLAILAVMGSWLLWLGISFIPGYCGPQIFIYGWQYGYFPGFVWDEAMELTHGYWFSRLIVFASLGMSFWCIRLPKKWYSLLAAILIPAGVAALDTYLLSQSYPQCDVIETDTMVRRELSKTFTSGRATIHYQQLSLTKDEIEYLRYSTRVTLDSIASFFALGSDTSAVNIYLYPSAAVMSRYVGTQNASVSKPWRSELHIAKENLSSLQHELVHVLLHKQGSFPFSVSHSTGLTEGAAEAFDSVFNGIHTINDVAVTILQDSLARGVSGIMGFLGFASNASGKSYALTGSFSSYLHSKYGAAAYLSLYATRDYQSIYHRSLESLDSQWQRSLLAGASPMSHDDSLRTNYYFNKHSIIADPCLRRIGKMMKQARAVLMAKQYRRADSLYEVVANESGRTDAIGWRMYCHLYMNDAKGALAILDTSTGTRSETARAPYHLMRGDLLYLTNDTVALAEAEWAIAERLELTADQVCNAVVRLVCFTQASNRPACIDFIKGYYNNSRSSELDTLLSRIMVTSPSAQGVPNMLLFVSLRSFELARLAEFRGELRLAMNNYQVFINIPCENTLPQNTRPIPLLTNEAMTIVTKYAIEHYKRYEEAFGSAEH